MAASSHTFSTIAADHAIAATFAANTAPGAALVRNGTTLVEYQTLQDAYNGAVSGNSIQLRSGTHAGSALYALGTATVTLNGGYDAAFSEATRDFSSVISSPLVIRGGRVNVNGSAIGP